MAEGPQGVAVWSDGARAANRGLIHGQGCEALSRHQRMGVRDIRARCGRRHVQASQALDGIKRTLFVPRLPYGWRKGARLRIHELCETIRSPTVKPQHIRSIVSLS